MCVALVKGHIGWRPWLSASHRPGEERGGVAVLTAPGTVKTLKGLSQGNTVKHWEFIFQAFPSPICGFLVQHVLCWYLSVRLCEEVLPRGRPVGQPDRVEEEAM